MKREPRMQKDRQPISVCLIILLAVTFITAGTGTVLADETSCDAMAQPRKAVGGVGHCALCCPGDYIRKPSPCVSPISCCCPDTYCPKPCLILPCPAVPCCRDDYCPKPLPSLCRPLFSAWYKCVPLIPCELRRSATCAGKNE